MFDELGIDFNKMFSQDRTDGNLSCFSNLSSNFCINNSLILARLTVILVYIENSAFILIRFEVYSFPGKLAIDFLPSMLVIATLVGM